MRLTCIGTGTAAPEGDRACSGYWVEAGESRLLLDCGPGVVHSLARHDVAWHTLTHLVLTHFHNDHTGDIPFLFFALHYGLAERRRAPLPVIGPVGTKKLFQRLGAAFGAHVARPKFEVTFTELGGSADVALPGARLRAHHANHTPGALAYRIEADGSAIGYTGDTGESEELGAFMAGVDVLVAECSLPDDQAMDSHLTPGRLARLAVQARPRVLVPTHVYPQLARRAVPEALRSAGWEGKTVVAEDGLVLE